MTIYELHRETTWSRRRRINRMMTKLHKHDVGVVLPDRTWHVIALVAGITLLNAVLFVNLWL